MAKENRYAMRFFDSALSAKIGPAAVDLYTMPHLLHFPRGCSISAG
jgi:hypothetical protein